MFNNLPAYMRKRNKTPDFPSAHSKRSFLKMDALENKRLKSYGTKIISPHDYLTESVQRHRAVSMSPLRDRLNLKDKDVNLPWDPSAHPGPRHKLELSSLFISLGLDKPKKSSLPSSTSNDQISQKTISATSDKWTNTNPGDLSNKTRPFENNPTKDDEADSSKTFETGFFRRNYDSSIVSPRKNASIRLTNNEETLFSKKKFVEEHYYPEKTKEDLLRSTKSFEQIEDKRQSYYSCILELKDLLSKVKNYMMDRNPQRRDEPFFNEPSFHYPTTTMQKNNVEATTSAKRGIAKPNLHNYPSDAYSISSNGFEVVRNSPEDYLSSAPKINYYQQQWNGNPDQFYHKFSSPKHSPRKNVTWKRFYPVEKPHEIISNKITNSAELLNHERFDINLDRRKATFIPKPLPPPKIQHSKVWTPPPEEPYKFPKPRPPRRSIHDTVPDKLYEWNPTILYEDYKYERKNFTPEPSPPYDERLWRGYEYKYERKNFTPEPSPPPRQKPTTTYKFEQKNFTPADQSSPSPPTTSRPSPCRLLNDGHHFRTPPPQNLHDHLNSMTLSGSSINLSEYDNESKSSNVRDERLNGGANTRREVEQARTLGTNIRKKVNLFEPENLKNDDAPRCYFSDKMDAILIRRRQEYLLESSSSTAKKADILRDLDELAKRRERLFDRSKNRSALNIHELRKVDPNYVDLPERSPEESFETRADYSSKSSGRDLYRSHSVMSSEWENYDKNIAKTRSQTNLASWQFNNASFSPRSVINVNGHQNDTGLLRIRTDLSPAPVKFPVPVVQKSNAGVQTQTKTEQVTRTVVNEPQPQPPPFWNVPPGAMPQIVFVPVAAPASAPNTLTRETVKEEKIRYVRDYEPPYPSDSDSRQGTLIRIKDESSKKPPSSSKHVRRKHVIKQEKYGFESEGENLAEKENRQVAIPHHHHRYVQDVVQPVIEPKVTETVSTVEETKRTEEVERRVRAENKKKHRQHKSHGHHHRSHEGHLEDGYQQQERIGYQSHGQNGHSERAVDYPPWTTPFDQSKPALTAPNGYHPSVTENYQKQTTTKRIHDSDIDGTMRSKYAENGGPHYGQDSRIHRSYSSNNVYHNEHPIQTELHYEDNRPPIVEYPPSLQRDSGGNSATLDDRFYNRHGSRHLGRYGRRGGSELSSSGLGTPQKSDYKDSLLMPVPGGNVNEREYRRENIPGGHETFSRTLKSQSGARNNGNGITQFSEAKQESNLRRETNERKY